MTCPALSLENGGLADVLRSIDCRTGESTAIAFGRLFGHNGALMPALTGLLTLYVALFAIGLLTGRTRIGIATLTPRMLTLGMVLTFATSWLAYQNVVWTLATGAPDQLATLIAGTHGSATTAFANKLDMIFQAIADSTRQSPTNAVAAANAAAPGTSVSASLLSPQGMLWISGLMLLVGTVGVLVTAKVALAALLAIGPVFILLAVFPATRGLFEGWLKGVVSFALVPLFTVLIGGATLTLIAPLIRDAIMDSTEVATRSATALFLAACIYCALMAIVAKTAATIVGGWRLPFSAAPEEAVAAAPPLAPTQMAYPALTASPVALAANQRVRSMIAALPAPDADLPGVISPSAHARTVAVGILSVPSPAQTLHRTDHRLQGVGSRFRAPPTVPSKARLS